MDEEEIRALGAEALTRKLVRVICRDRPIDEPEPSEKLVVLIDDETCGAILTEDGRMSPFNNVQVFFKWGTWYNTAEQEAIIAQHKKQVTNIKRKS